MDLQKTTYILNEFKKAGIELTEKQAEQYEIFYEMLVEKNKVMNLTGITEFEQVVKKHFLDSVYRVDLPKNKKIKVMDVGTGAGFPGIPLKILYPDIEITLLDSLQKRLDFIEEVVERTDLAGVSLIHGRAEDFGQNTDYREKYDFVLSRAVANLSSLCEYCLPFVKTGGKFISYKSGQAGEEIMSAVNAVKMLGGDENHIGEEYFSLPESDDKRCLVTIRKSGTTNKKYPRKAGVPSKKPL